MKDYILCQKIKEKKATASELIQLDVAFESKRRATYFSSNSVFINSKISLEASMYNKN